jgi:osmotically-inducible protein OsmY
MALALGLAVGLCGCSQDADGLARVCQKTAAKFDGVTENLRGKLQDGWGAVRGSLHESGLDSRVALRLHWDQDLEGANISVALAGAGVVCLTGDVTTLAQRRRAVALAQSTAGVEKVLDELHVGEEER